MDSKDHRSKNTLGECISDGSASFKQNDGQYQSVDKNKSYLDIGSNSLGKMGVQPVRPCAVIGPDRVSQPPQATVDPYHKKVQIELEPWQYNPYPFNPSPQYHQKSTEYSQNSQSISPRQTIQDNMQRMMVPPRYNPSTVKEDQSSSIEKNSSSQKNHKMNEPKYCDVPYIVNPVNNEQKPYRSADVAIQSASSTFLRAPPQTWSQGGIRGSHPYPTGDMYHFPEYGNVVPRVAAARPQRLPTEDPSQMYPVHYYRNGNIRFEPYPTMKERYPAPRYDYIPNYSNPYQAPPHYPYKGTSQSMSTHAYPGHVQGHMIRDPVIEGYQRNIKPPNNYNIPYPSQSIHPKYNSIPGNCMQNKSYIYANDCNVNALASVKPSYDNTKYYMNPLTKPYQTPENYYMNEYQRPQYKGQMMIPNYPMNGHGIPYYRKENLHPKKPEFTSPIKNNEPPYYNTAQKYHPQNVPTMMSPTDPLICGGNYGFSNVLDDLGYASQSSTASVRSIDSGIDMYKNYDQRFINGINLPRVSIDTNLGSSDKNGLDVRQFLSNFNVDDDEGTENNENSAKGSDCEVVSNKEQLYVLGLVNVPTEELAKYEHIQKVSKLPDNIKGYTSIELLNQFEEAMNSSDINTNNSPSNNKDIVKKTAQNINPPKSVHSGSQTRPLSPLDVEAKISQSVIHKDVGCNFEIKPCSPKMLNAQEAAPVEPLLSERLIEKVSNPIKVKSPTALTNMDESDSVNDRKHRNINLSECQPLIPTSCKMIQSQCAASSNEVLKADYSVQDLERTAGVCLASLPRLDNDIELSFPEVNQQFIDANKGDKTMHSGDLPCLDICSDSFTDGSNNPSVEFTHIEKESNDKYNLSIAQNLYIRTNSVIIKNPDNTEKKCGFEEKCLTESVHEKEAINSLNHQNNAENEVTKASNNKTNDLDCYENSAGTDKEALNLSANATHSNQSNRKLFVETGDKSPGKEITDINVTSVKLETDIDEYNPLQPNSEINLDHGNTEPAKVKFDPENISTSSALGPYNTTYEEISSHNSDLSIVSNKNPHVSDVEILNTHNENQTNKPCETINNCNMVKTETKFESENMQNAFDNSVGKSLLKEGSESKHKNIIPESEHEFVSSSLDSDAHTERNSMETAVVEDALSHETFSSSPLEEDDDKHFVASNVSKEKKILILTNLSSNDTLVSDDSVTIISEKSFDDGESCATASYSKTSSLSDKNDYEVTCQKSIKKGETRKLNDDFQAAILSPNKSMEDNNNFDSPCDDNQSETSNSFSPTHTVTNRHIDCATLNDDKENDFEMTEHQKNGHSGTADAEDTEPEDSVKLTKSLGKDFIATIDIGNEKDVVVSHHAVDNIIRRSSYFYIKRFCHTFKNLILYQEGPCYPQTGTVDNKANATDSFISKVIPVVENDVPKSENITTDEIQAEINTTALSNDISLGAKDYTRPKRIKRSLSDSALYSDLQNEHSNEKVSEYVFKHKKRKRNLEQEEVTPEDLLANSYLNLLPINFRRNSIASIYEEENVSFCILTEDHCLIPLENNYEDGTIGFVNIETALDAGTPEIKKDVILGSDQSDSNLLSESMPQNSVAYIDNSFDQNWLEDVACVETVVSDEVEDELDYISSTPSAEGLDHVNSVYIDEAKHIYGVEMFGDDRLIESFYATPEKDDVNHNYEDEFDNLPPNETVEPETAKSVLEDTLAIRDTQLKEETDAAVNTDTEDFETCCTTDYPSEEKQTEDQFKCQVQTKSVTDYLVDNANVKRNSSSPEVTSTTPEEHKRAGILLKITNLNGSRTSQINNTGSKNKLRCRLTEDNKYSQIHSKSNTIKPLITKGAQKYIPPIHETFSDFKIKLQLPQQSLAKYKKLKTIKEESKKNINSNWKIVSNKIRKEYFKKSKPKFEDVLKSIDDMHIKLHKEKIKKPKPSVPKMIIKKTESGSHYARSTNEDFNPDLTGRKWQPWVFIKKDDFIDKMALHGKNRAIYCHRKRCFILIEKYRKYKSVLSTKFVISQTKSKDVADNPLKCTIKLHREYT